MPLFSRQIWMKLHAYLACFFLPFTLLYILTGIFHLFDIHGEHKKTAEYVIELADVWPNSEPDAERVVKQLLIQKNHSSLPDNYYPDYPKEGDHEWFGGKQEVTLQHTGIASQAKLVIKEHGMLQQLLFIHKGIAGNLAWFIGVMFGLHLLISVISGVALVLQMPTFKAYSVLSLASGFILLVYVFVR